MTSSGGPMILRVLTIDDNPAIHEDFKKILSRDTQADTALAAEEALLLGEVPAQNEDSEYELYSALQGEAGVELARQARVEGRPFAVAFIDMRMPPGWDGVETVERLWHADPRLQIVFCTAYSDYSWKEILQRLDVRDRLLILKKPFDPIEVYQFANALTTKWQMTEQAAFKMERLEHAVEERTR